MHSRIIQVRLIKMPLMTLGTTAKHKNTVSTHRQRKLIHSKIKIIGCVFSVHISYIIKKRNQQSSIIFPRSLFPNILKRKNDKLTTLEQ